MLYKSNWGISLHWETTFKLPSINPHQNLLLKHFTEMTAFFQLRLTVMTVGGNDVVKDVD